MTWNFGTGNQIAMPILTRETDRFLSADHRQTNHDHTTLTTIQISPTTLPGMQVTEPSLVANLPGRSLTTVRAVALLYPASMY